MKVLHVIPSLSLLHGGPSTALPLMARGLTSKGIEVHVVSTDAHGSGHLDVPLEQDIEKDGYTTRFFRRQTRFYTASWPLTNWLSQHVRHFDVVHIHALFSYASIPAAFHAHRHNVPYIIRPLGTLNQWGMLNRRPGLKQLSFRLIESRIVQNAAAMHYTSEQERDEAAQLGIDTYSVILPIGIDLSGYSTLPPKDEFKSSYPVLYNRFILLFLSRIDAKKGLDLLLPAFASLHQRYQQVILVIAGRGDEQYTSQMQQLAQQLGIADHIVWAGFIEGRDKLAALSAADVFVLPSYSENFGIAAVEAMAAGLPVIISNQVGFAPEVDKADAGLVVPCELDSLTAALTTAITDSNTLRVKSRNARRLAYEQYSVEAMADGLVKLYRDVLRRSSGGGLE